MSNRTIVIIGIMLLAAAMGSAHDVDDMKGRAIMSSS